MGAEEMEEVIFPVGFRKADGRKFHLSRAMRMSRGLLGNRERMGILDRWIGVEKGSKVGRSNC